MMKLIEQHYSPKEAGSLLRLHKNTVLKEIAVGVKTEGREGIAPVFYVAHNRIRIPGSAIQRFLDRLQIRIKG
jgi:hypothetical protein